MEGKHAERGSAGLLCDQPAENRDMRRLDPNLAAPNFFIVGAAKAGTTSLHAYLARHPEVFMSPLKEPHYFSSFLATPEHNNFDTVVRQADSYQQLFAGSQSFKAIGEASPSYLCDPEAANRIKLAIPDARIIISLRDPVQRAYSHYLMEHRQGRETRSFMEAVEEDRKSRNKGWGVSFQYIELGLYADQVARYLEVFDRRKVLVILFEDLSRDTRGVMGEVSCFLEIDPEGFNGSAFERTHNPYEESRGRVARLLLRSHAMRVFSKRWIPKSVRASVRRRFFFKTGVKPRLDGETARALSRYFEADLARLEHILGRDLGALRKSW